MLVCSHATPFQTTRVPRLLQLEALEARVKGAVEGLEGAAERMRGTDRQAGARTGVRQAPCDGDAHGNGDSSSEDEPDECGGRQGRGAPAGRSGGGIGRNGSGGRCGGGTIADEEVLRQVLLSLQRVEQNSQPHFDRTAARLRPRP
jgi:hypothetical protein